MSPLLPFLTPHKTMLVNVTFMIGALTRAVLKRGVGLCLGRRDLTP